MNTAIAREMTTSTAMMTATATMELPSDWVEAAERVRLKRTIQISTYTLRTSTQTNNAFVRSDPIHVFE